jgi:hypothetical protein
MENKKFLLLLLAFVAIAALFAFRIPIQSRWQYCTIVARGSFLSSKVKIYVDYGQEKGNRLRKANQLKDAGNNVMQFNTIVDALNYMDQQGWECAQAYTMDTNCIQYLLRKPAD